MNFKKEGGRVTFSARKENMVFQSSRVTEGNKPQLVSELIRTVMHKNRNVQSSLHLECCSFSLGTILESRAKCSAGKHDRQSWSGQRKSSACRMEGQSLYIKQGKRGFTGTPKVPSPKAVTLSWGFLLFLLACFFGFLFVWSFLFASVFLCLLEILLSLA